LRLHSAMDLEVESRVVCPYCGAVFTTVVDTSFGTFSTIEDCEVCCRPIALNVHCHYGEIDSVDFDRA
jgi:Cysteine-rich CPXCG